MTFHRLPIAGFALALSVAGCAVGPDFARPPAPDAQSYESAPLPEKTESADNENGAAQTFVAVRDLPADWWKIFHSEPLNELVIHAIKSNPDIAAAKASLRAAEEDVAAGESILFPAVTGSFSTSRQKTSGASSGGNFHGTIYTLHNATVDVSYGIDVFGGARRAIEELRAEEDFQRFQLEATYVSLTANVITAAVQEASLRGQIEASKKIIEQESQSLDVLNKQLELGGIARIPVAAQAATVAQSKALLPPLEKQLAAVRHELSVLAGELPSQEPKGVFKLSELKLPQDLPVTIPSQLVEQRPDVRAAEANLHAASAAIGIAEAARLPQFTLSADVGDVANAIGKMFSPGTGIWSAGFNVAQVLFDAGKLEHQQRAAEAEFDVAAAQYRKTVLAAFQDVADTLYALRADAMALKAQSEAAAAAGDNLKLTKEQFDAGSITYLSLLNAEQQQQQAQISLAQAEAARFADTAALYQALGGGWWNRVPDNQTDQQQTEETHD